MKRKRRRSQARAIYRDERKTGITWTDFWRSRYAKTEARQKTPRGKAA